MHVKHQKYANAHIFSVGTEDQRTPLRVTIGGHLDGRHTNGDIYLSISSYQKPILRISKNQLRIWRLAIEWCPSAWISPSIRQEQYAEIDLRLRVWLEIQK